MDQERINKLAQLAMIFVSDEESMELVESIDGVLQHIASLNTLSTDNTEPMIQPFLPECRSSQFNVFNPQSDKILKNAPARTGAFIRVPPTVI